MLMGTGMAFPWPVVARTDLATGHIVEDMKLGVDLASKGLAPLYCPEAEVVSYFPDSSQGFKTQRTRWEHGHLGLILAEAPNLFAKAICGSQWSATRHGIRPDCPTACSAVLAGRGDVYSLSTSGDSFRETGPLWAGSVRPCCCLASSSPSLGRRFARSVISAWELAFAPVYALLKIPRLSSLRLRQTGGVGALRKERRMTPANDRLCALVGPGRSGTTWAGSLLDSCPEVIYRFEPFHRMAPINSDFRGWMHRLKQQEVRQQDLQQLYPLLSKAHPLTNKEPFFPKRYRQFTLGRRQLWPVARVFPVAARAYGALYSPPCGAPIIFKEVTFIRPLQNLLEKTDVPIIYLVRHPCATVLSEVYGQEKGKMPSGRQQRLKEILCEHSPDLADRFADVCARIGHAAENCSALALRGGNLPSPDPRVEERHDHDVRATCR